MDGPLSKRHVPGKLVIHRVSNEVVTWRVSDYILSLLLRKLYYGMKGTLGWQPRPFSCQAVKNKLDQLSLMLVKSEALTCPVEIPGLRPQYVVSEELFTCQAGGSREFIAHHNKLDKIMPWVWKSTMLKSQDQGHNMWLVKDYLHVRRGEFYCTS